MMHFKKMGELQYLIAILLPIRLKTSLAKWKKRYQNHLAPLTKRHQQKIQTESIKMLTLLEASFLTTCVEHYCKGEIDQAGTNLKNATAQPRRDRENTYYQQEKGKKEIELDA